METILSVQGATRRYPKFTLHPIQLELPAGVIMGLIGPNGAGKSTLLKAIMNLIPLDGGRIEVFGMDHGQQEVAIKKHVGFVSEEMPLYEDLTGQYLGRFLSRFYESWDGGHFEKLAQHFKVDLSQPYGKLSKGNKMKLALCLALAHHPRLLLLDEPTAGLDPLARRDLLEEMLEVIGDEKRSVIFSTHITSDVERVADYLAVIADGQIRFSGPRYNLQDSWRRVLSSKPFPAETAGILAGMESRFGGYAGVTGDFPGLQKRWPGGLPEGVQVEAMSLEDILIAIAKGGDGHVGHCG